MDQTLGYGTSGYGVADCSGGYGDRDGYDDRDGYGGGGYGFGGYGFGGGARRGWQSRDRPEGLFAAERALRQECSGAAGVGSDAFGAVLRTGLRLGIVDYFVWGPRLVRATLSPDCAAHRTRSLEQRREFAECLRRVIHYGHQVRDIDPEWQRLTDAAFEEARIGFLAGAPTAAQLEQRKRLEALSALVGHVPFDQLTTDPLVREELRLDGLDAVVRERAGRLADLIAAALPSASDPVIDEVHAVARRLLDEVARESRVLHQKTRDDSIAAGLAIMAAGCNGVGEELGLSRRQIISRIGAPSSAGGRGISVLQQARVRTWPSPRPPAFAEPEWLRYDRLFTDPRLQTSATRRLILRSRGAIIASGVAATPPSPGEVLRPVGAGEPDPPTTGGQLFHLREAKA